MTKDEIISILKANEAVLRRAGVDHIALFGSAARDEARPESDVDIMIDIDPKVQVDLYGYVAISQLIGDLFPSSVDVSERRALRPAVRSTAERDAVFAF